jgi:thiamine pyrophosphate-dependent acetolactate synthase large subunit-like protein
MTAGTTVSKAAPTLDRRMVVPQLLAGREQELLVCTGLGSPTWDVSAAGDHEQNFYVNGTMGSATMVGLGWALAQPSKRVMCITGDGELLMSLGSLATIAVAAPKNYTVVVLDNERYGETGNQPTHTAFGVDLEAVAKACAFPSACTIRTQAELEAALPKLRRADGPHFVVIKIAPDRNPMIMPPIDPAYTKGRVRESLLGHP